MKTVPLLLLVAALSGCAVCSSSDNAEQCRTKQRDHSNPRTDFALPLPGRGVHPALL